MTQYEEMRTVWWTRARVEMVLKDPMEGDSTPEEVEQDEIFISFRVRTTADLE
jgi:hypothetical protein